VLILNPAIIFVFSIVKMDITPKKGAKIVALNEQTSVTVKDLASVVGVGKSSVSKFFVHIRILDHFLQREKENTEENEKAPSY
jgi:predicted transcriptional regulator